MLNLNGNINNINKIAEPNVLFDGNTIAWYDYTKKVTKDGSDFVSVWGDISGNSNNLLQAIGTNQPLWRQTGILFDGIDNFMKATFTFNQPEQIYIVLRQVSWTANRRLFDGGNDATGALQQHPSTPSLFVYAGSQSSANANLAVGSFGIVKILFNGASGKFQINKTTEITGNFGSLNMGGIVLGARGDTTGSYSNVEFKEAILRNVADSAENKSDIDNYLSRKYGI